MKNLKYIFFAVLLIPVISLAQDKKDGKEKIIEDPAFDSATLIDNATNVLNPEKTLEVQLYHRFGLINDGTNDMAGIWAPSNIRIGLSYAITDYLTVGYGTTKFDRLQDFNLKVGLLKQTKSNAVPISLSYYGDVAIDARTKDNFNLKQDRYSYFNQIIIARRFCKSFSATASASISHYNLVEPTAKNDMIGVSWGARCKISPNTAIITDLSFPLTKFNSATPKPGVSLGVEFSTYGHAFQVFVTNVNGLVPQKNYMTNQNDFFKGDFMIGFNITRLYNF